MSSNMSLSESVRDLHVVLSMIVNLEKELNDQKLVDIILSIVMTAKKGVTNATGGALHRLGVTKPSIDAVNELVQENPDTVSFKNEQDRLPVQKRSGTLIVSNTFLFSPKLASTVMPVAENCVVDY